MKYFKFKTEESDYAPFVLLKRFNENEIRSAYKGECFIKEISKEDYDSIINQNHHIADRFEDRFLHYCKAWEEKSTD